MPGQAIIGKVAVKVIPDTTGFKQELQTQLNAIEKELNSIEVKIEPKIDQAQVVAEAKAAGKAAQEAIGNVTLKVNLDDQDSIRRNLSILENQLKKLGEDFPLKVDFSNMDEVMTAIDLLEERLSQVAHLRIVVDEDDRGSIERALKKINAEIQALAEAEIEPIDIKLDLDSLKAERDRLQLIADHLEAIELDVKFDSDRAAQLLKDHIEGLEFNNRFDFGKTLNEQIQNGLNGLTVSPDLEPGTAEKLKAQIERDLLRAAELQIKVDAELDPIAKRKLQLEIEALERNVHDLTVKLNPELDNGAAARTEGLLKILSRARTVSIRPVVDNRATRSFLQALNVLSGHRAGVDFTRDLFRTLSKLDLLLPKIATLGTALFGLGASLVGGVGGLAALASDLASIGGIAFALPGAFVSLGIAIGVAKVALEDFGKQLPEVASLYGTLKQTVSDAFWAEARDQMRTALTELFPEIEAGLSGVGTAMGNFFGNLAESVNKILGGQLEGMFQNVSDGFDDLATHTDALARIFGVLGRVGSQFFQDMLERLGDATERWADWLEEAEKTGRLKEIIENGVDALIDLGRVLTEIVQIFDAISDAYKRAFGENTLGSLADGLKRVREAMDSEEFQKELTEVFEAIGKMFDEIGERAGPAVQDAFRNLGNALEEILPDVGATIGEFVGGIADAFNQPRLQSGLTNFFDSLAGFAETVRPAFDDVGEAVGAVLDLLSTFVQVSAPGAADALTLFSNVITTLADGLRPFIEDFIPAVNGLFNAMSPAIQRIAQAVADFFNGPGGQALVQFVRDITPGVEKLAGFMADVAEAIVEWANANLGDILETWAGWFNDFATWVDEHKDTIIAFLTGFLDVVKELVTNLPLLVAALGALAAVNLAAAITNIGGLRLALAGLAAVIRNWPTALVLFGFFEFLTANSEDDGVEGWLGRLRDTLGEILDFINVDLSGTPGANEGTWLEDVDDALSNLSDGIQDFLDMWGNAAGPLGLIWDFFFGEGEGEIAPPEPPDFPQLPPGGPPSFPYDKPQSNFENLPFYVTPDQLDAAQRGYDALEDLFQNHWNNMETLGNEGSDALAQQLGQMFQDMQGQWDQAKPNLFNSWDEFWLNFRDTLTNNGVAPEIAQQLTDLFRGMQGNLNDFGALFGEDWARVWDQLLVTQDLGGGQMSTGLGITLASMQTQLGPFGQQFTTQFATMWSTANQIGGEQGLAMQQALRDMLLGMNGDLNSGMNTLNGTWRTQWASLPGGMTPGINSAVILAGGVPGRILGAFGNVSNLLYSVGANIMGGLAAGISANAGAAARAAVSAVLKVKAAAESAAQVASPSKVFMQIGEYLMQGMAKGITRASGEASRAMSYAVGDLATRAQGEIPEPASGRVGAIANGFLDSSGSTTNNRTLNYYAAPGHSLSSEDDLFKASARARMGW